MSRVGQRIAGAAVHPVARLTSSGETQVAAGKVSGEMNISASALRLAGAGPGAGLCKEMSLCPADRAAFLLYIRQSHAIVHFVAQRNGAYSCPTLTALLNDK